MSNDEIRPIYTFDFKLKNFNSLQLTQITSIAGDTLLTVALADSLFFDLDPNDARWRVALYLILTIAPFALVAPLLGPLMDKIKGGHKWMAVFTALIRAGLMVLIFFNLNSLLLFPLAFLMLVMGKTYAITKSALVPVFVENSNELVKVNANLSIISAVSAGLAAILGISLLQIDASWVLFSGSFIFLACMFFAIRIPSTSFGQSPETAIQIEQNSNSVRVASIVMGYIRLAVGFVTMLLAFSLRGVIDPGPQGPGVEFGHRVREALGGDKIILTSGGAPAWYFGVAIFSAGIGGLLGAILAPQLRRKFDEEKLLFLDLVFLFGTSIIAFLFSNDLIIAVVISLSTAFATQVGKQAFDSLVQKDAPQESLGTIFSKYETRFQLLWVFGALIPVLISLTLRIGVLAVGVTALVVVMLYWTGRTNLPAFSISGLKSNKSLDDNSHESSSDSSSSSSNISRSEISSGTEKMPSEEP